MGRQLSTAEQVLQRPAIDEFQNKELVSILIGQYCVDRNDPRMAELGGGPGFKQQFAAECPSIVGIVPEYLDCDIARQLRIPRLEDMTEAAASQKSLN